MDDRTRGGALHACEGQMYVKKAPRFVSQPADDDVLLGRGTRINRHKGNIRFREMVRSVGSEYLTCRTNAEKTIVARRLHSAVVNQGHEFLKRRIDKKSKRDRWEIIDTVTAMEKIKQSIRDAVRLGTHSRSIASEEIEQTTQQRNIPRTSDLVLSSGASCKAPPTAVESGKNLASYSDLFAATTSQIQQNLGAATSGMNPVAASLIVNPDISICDSTIVERRDRIGIQTPLFHHPTPPSSGTVSVGRLPPMLHSLQQEMNEQHRLLQQQRWELQDRQLVEALHYDRMTQIQHIHLAALPSRTAAGARSMEPQHMELPQLSTTLTTTTAEFQERRQHQLATLLLSRNRRKASFSGVGSTSSVGGAGGVIGEEESDQLLLNRNMIIARQQHSLSRGQSLDDDIVYW